MEKDLKSSTFDNVLFDYISTTDKYDLENYTDSENVEKFKMWMGLKYLGYSEAELFFERNYQMLYPYLIGLGYIETKTFQYLTPEAFKYLKFICAFDNEEQFRLFYKDLVQKDFDSLFQVALDFGAEKIAIFLLQRSNITELNGPTKKLIQNKKLRQLRKFVKNNDL